MKKISLALFAFASFNAFGYNSYVAKQTTCADLKNAVEAEGKILVKGPWIFSRFIYDSPNACSYSEKAVVTYWHVKDGKCKLRWGCERDNSQDR